MDVYAALKQAIEASHREQRAHADEWRAKGKGPAEYGPQRLTYLDARIAAASAREIANQIDPMIDAAPIGRLLGRTTGVVRHPTCIGLWTTQEEVERAKRAELEIADHEAIAEVGSREELQASAREELDQLIQRVVDRVFDAKTRPHELLNIVYVLRETLHG